MKQAWKLQVRVNGLLVANAYCLNRAAAVKMLQRITEHGLKAYTSQPIKTYSFTILHVAKRKGK